MGTLLSPISSSNLTHGDKSVRPTPASLEFPLPIPTLRGRLF